MERNRDGEGKERLDQRERERVRERSEVDQK